MKRADGLLLWRLYPHHQPLQNNERARPAFGGRFDPLSGRLRNYMASRSRPRPNWMLWIFVMFFWVFGIGGAYILWSIVNPDRLQTEDYQKFLHVLTDERHPGKTIEHAPLTSNTVVGVIK
jgi:hypothetical protein